MRLLFGSKLPIRALSRPSLLTLPLVPYAATRVQGRAQCVRERKDSLGRLTSHVTYHCECQRVARPGFGIVGSQVFWTSGGVLTLPPHGRMKHGRASDRWAEAPICAKGAINEEGL